MIQAGAVGILGLGMAELDLLRAQEAAHPARRVIYIFLSGGLTQHESFDPKPDAPDTIRGEFQPAATRTPGVHITEHLPLLAARSDKWAIVRSLTHPSNGHSEGHHIMLTGRTPLPVGFDGNRPRPGDFPAIAAVANYATRSRNNLPPAVVLPMTLVHRTGRVIPGQAPIPRRGKLVAIQYREAATGRWRPVLVTRTDHAGRFRAHYRFRYVSGRSEIRLRATALGEESWPYAPGSSRPLTVTVEDR